MVASASRYLGPFVLLFAVGLPMGIVAAQIGCPFDHGYNPEGYNPELYDPLRKGDGYDPFGPRCLALEGGALWWHVLFLAAAALLTMGLLWWRIFLQAVQEACQGADAQYCDGVCDITGPKYEKGSGWCIAAARTWLYIRVALTFIVLVSGWADLVRYWRGTGNDQLGAA